MVFGNFNIYIVNISGFMFCYLELILIFMLLLIRIYL